MTRKGVIYELWRTNERKIIQNTTCFFLPKRRKKDLGKKDDKP